MTEYISREDVLKKAKSSISVPADNEWDCGYNTAMAEMQEFIKHLTATDVQPVDRWISVDERLPNTDERVLVYIPRPDNHYNIEIAYISEGNDDYPYWVLRDKSQFYSTRFYYISHWQSLPEPPKDGDTNG